MAKGEDMTNIERLRERFTKFIGTKYDPKNLSITHEEMDSVIKAFEHN